MYKDILNYTNEKKIASNAVKTAHKILSLIILNVGKAIINSFK